MRSLALRRRLLCDTAERRIALTWYPPGHAMAAHAHDVDQRSVLLAGALEERAGSQTSTLQAGTAGFKAAGVRHANLYGRDGALILAIDGPAPGDVRDQGEWRWRQAWGLNAIRRVLGATLSGGVCLTEAANDLVALAGPTDGSADAPRAPRWLGRVREAIDDDPAAARVEALAAEAGVHRVHLSRRFADVFSVPFSLYRRRAMTARGVRTLLHEQDGVAAAAAEAGFADQAHFTRALKAETGLTPARLAAAFA